MLQLIHRFALLNDSQITPLRCVWIFASNCTNICTTWGDSPNLILWNGCSHSEFVFEANTRGTDLHKYVYFEVIESKYLTRLWFVTKNTNFWIFQCYSLLECFYTTAKSKSIKIQRLSYQRRKKGRSWICTLQRPQSNCLLLNIWFYCRQNLTNLENCKTIRI